MFPPHELPQYGQVPKVYRYYIRGVNRKMTVGRETPDQTGQPEVPPRDDLAGDGLGPYPGCSNGPYDAFVWLLASAYLVHFSLELMKGQIGFVVRVFGVAIAKEIVDVGIADTVYATVAGVIVRVVRRRSKRT
jgi:hypothetical protein